MCNTCRVRFSCGSCSFTMPMQHIINQVLSISNTYRHLRLPTCYGYLKGKIFVNMQPAAACHASSTTTPSFTLHLPYQLHAPPSEAR
jgi:hypothetical protein